MIIALEEYVLILFYDFSFKKKNSLLECGLNLVTNKEELKDAVTGAGLIVQWLRAPTALAEGFHPAPMLGG